MKGLFCLLFVFSCIDISSALAETTAAKSEELSLDIRLSTTETSKDAHGHAHSLVINNNTVTYSARHFGADPRPTVEENFALGKEERDRLIQYIRKNALNRNITERKEKARLGTSVSVIVNMQIGDTLSHATISGAYSDWIKVQQGKPASNLDNLDYCHGIESLLTFMRINFGFNTIEP